MNSKKHIKLLLICGECCVLTFLAYDLPRENIETFSAGEISYLLFSLFMVFSCGTVMARVSNAKSINILGIGSVALGSAVSAFIKGGENVYESAMVMVVIFVLGRCFTLPHKTINFLSNVVYAIAVLEVMLALYSFSYLEQLWSGMEIVFSLFCLLYLQFSCILMRHFSVTKKFLFHGFDCLNFLYIPYILYSIYLFFQIPELSSNANVILGLLSSLKLILISGCIIFTRV